ncbi:MAG TPA: TonB-dependent receptor [Candidatus Acidoferrales bacterium]|nr:TonB-dependent receptor [Candidatus Acidoferrales bacterium]
MRKEQRKGWYFEVWLAALLVGAMALCLPAGAQTFRGTIIGTVTDPSGALVAGATVTATNTATGQTRSTVTSSDGSYSIPELTIGTYTLTATKPGFETAVATGVSVEIARERHVDFTLKPGNVSQRVEVKEEAIAPIETTNNNLGIQFESKDIVDLPVNGRDINKLYIMSPGVTGDPSGAGGEPGSYGQFSANGNRDRSNNFLLDGTDMNDSYRNLPAINQGGVFAIPATILPVETIAEVRVLTNFDAEYGRSSGAVVNIVTKSGTNDFHGSVFDYFRNSVLNARNFFNTVGPKDAFRNNQFGAALGGPIVKNKTFFYGAYEGQREGLGLTSLNTVPSLNDPNAPAGLDYAQSVVALGGTAAPCTTTVFACISGQPAGVINPVILNLYNLCNTKGSCSGGISPWPSPNVGDNGNVSSDRSKNDVNSAIIKVDHTFNTANTITGRYFYGHSNQSLPLGTGGGNNIPNTNTVSPTTVQLASVSLVSVVSPTKVNEARFGFNRYHEGFFPEDTSIFGNPATSLGLNTCLGLVQGSTVAGCGATAISGASQNDYGLPQITFSDVGLSSLGSSRFANPRNRIDRNYQFVDNFSWKFSKNDVKMGYEFRHTSVDSFQDLNFRGRIKFADLTGFLAGDVAGGAINYGTTERYTHQDSNSLFIEDSYRILPRVTINAGIRWDYYGVLREGSDGISIYSPTAGLISKNQPYKPDWNNFAPRLSVAWDPWGDGKTVVRAGAAVFYDAFSFDYFLGQLYENTNNLGPAYNPVGGMPVFQAFAVGGPLAAGVPVFDSSAAAIGFDTTDASTVARLKTPNVATFTLNIQRQLTANTVLQVGYVDTQGRKLQRIVDANQPSQAAITAYDVACTGGLGIALNASANPFCYDPGSQTLFTVPRNFNEFGTFFPILPGQNNFAAELGPLSPQTPFYLQQLETTAQSSYHALQVSITQRNWHGLTQQINYTWSHSIDDASDGQDFVPHAGQPNDSTNPSASNKGPSNFDVRHHFVWTLAYQLPKVASWGKLGEGWLVSSVVTIQSGHPFEVVDAGDDYDGSGEFFGRVDMIGKATYNFSDPSRFLLLDNFAVPCTLSGQGAAAPDAAGNFAQDCLSGTRHFGTEGRNALIGPAFRQWDFSIVKDTQITERLNLQLRVDAFNVLNHPNFSNPLLPSFFDDVEGFNLCSTVSPAAGCPFAGRFQSGQYFPIVATVDTGIGNPVLGGGGPRSFQIAAKLSF